MAKLSESEFMKVSPELTSVLVKSGPNKIDVLDSASLDLLQTFKADLPKCVVMSSKQIFVGNWSGNL